GKGLAGISLGGEFFSTGKFITENIGGSFITPDKIDFFRMKIGPELVDLPPNEITDIEFNTETQQIIFTRGVGRDENHVSRFQKLRLHKGGKTAIIDRFIPFNRGESNFEMAERFLATRFIQYEKARQIHQSSVELEYLTNRNLYAGDVTSQLVLSSMKLLNILPLEAPCLGSGPLDINNKVGVRQGFVKNADDLKAIFSSILDLKATPNFTEHDFNRLTKRIRLFIGNKEPLKLSAEEADDLLVELEHLTQYMDNYFNLNLYNRFEEDLEVDSADPHAGDSLDDDPEAHHLDGEAKDFISDNFAFFKKREVVRSALLQVESLRFYLSHVKVYADMPDKEPDLVVFSSGNSLVTHFQNTSYPSFALAGLLNKEVFASDSAEDDLAFIQFMRGFAKKVFQKAQEINKSFHHQYKHTLAELTFLADEKKEHLQSELALLEDPNNKEKAYAKLLEKLTKIFNEQLTQKEEGIEALIAEKAEIKGKIDGYFVQLEKLLSEKLEIENLDQILESMPTRLEEMKATILLHHKKKKNQIIKIYNPLSKFQTIVVNYYHNAYNFVGLFQKAFYVKKKEAMLVSLEAMIPKLLSMTPEQLEKKKAQWEQVQAPMSLAKESSEQAKALASKMKSQIIELQKYSVKGMFQNAEAEAGPLLEFFAYYEGEAQKMKDLGMQTKMLHQNLEETEKELFEMQSKIVDQRLAAEKKSLTVKMAQLALESPEAEIAIKKALEFNHEVPREIRKELNLLRQKLTAAQEVFKAAFTSETIGEACDFSKLNLKANKRSEINEIAKELVNLEQGYTMIDPEVEGEKEALEFLRGQEGKLEQVAMSKALPSTRILLKTQYIPLVEKEKKMLKRADLFLSEIVSRGDKLKEAFVNCFFRKRYAFPAFLRGSFCLDTSGTAKSATLKNINQAYLLLGEKYPKGCAPAAKYDSTAYLKKIEILGPGAIKERIRDIWTGGLEESFICVPGSYSMAIMLDLCKYKDELAKDINVSGRSNHSITLIYIAEINFTEIQSNPVFLEDYHQAIMSNLFINIDGVNIYNNRQSIYEGFIQSTFGGGTDAVSQQVATQFLTEV
ncbi:MAG: hypothetical protein QNL04_10720, partial [SAR324 cluster bacterium]|nr:hypothetical protein [SAR324 cluster bacterium]